jgi:cell division protease FtsH
MVVMFALLVVQLFGNTETPPHYTYSQMMADVAYGRVISMSLTPAHDVTNTGTATVVLYPFGVERSVHIPDTSIFLAELRYLGFGALETTAPSRPGFFEQFLPFLLIGAVLMVVMIFVMRAVAGRGGASGPMGFGRSRAKAFTAGEGSVKFDQVAGLEEEKEELSEIVEFLKNPAKYHKIGARIPRGILLVGQPGTGKTYLAKALAGEADVPFFSISGSDFVEMFVGVGASRVRDLFETAKKTPACVVFIDEIDAVGRRRGAGLGGGHDEREQTLNQLLVEMDGFGENTGVIILAATNRPDILDPALLRPGRFDRQVAVNPPDVKGREAVLRVHIKGKPMDEEVNLTTIAQTTSGFTPADIENLCNEAALLAARDNAETIGMEHFRKAYIKVGIGTEKKSRAVTPRDKRITAYHEAGHAVCFEVLPEMDATYMVSVIPTGRAGGYAMTKPGEERGYISKNFMEQSIVALLGGRAAEAEVLGDITTGAASDIERATSMARGMAVKFGMSDTLGPIQFGSEDREVFLGRDFAHTRNYSEQTADRIDAEIKRIVDAAYEKALTIVKEHIDVLHKIAELLIEKERVTGDEIRSLFAAGVLPDKQAHEGLLA